MEKPDRRFFDAVWKQTGRYERDEAVIVGDSLTSDMQGGINAGILTCWYNPCGIENTKHIKCDFEISDLNQVKQLLQ